MIRATTSAGCVEMRKFRKEPEVERSATSGPRNSNTFKFYFQHNKEMVSCEFP